MAVGQNDSSYKDLDASILIPPFCLLGRKVSQAPGWLPSSCAVDPQGSTKGEALAGRPPLGRLESPRVWHGPRLMAWSGG